VHDRRRETWEEEAFDAFQEEWTKDERGDAWQTPPNREPSRNGHAKGEREEPTFALLDSAAFARADYRLEWLVKRLLVKDQPTILGGPKKALKTSLLVDLAISLGTGKPFLGEFDVPRPVRVALLSGESGEATLQETARRVCAAKGVRLENAGVLWGFKLPQLADLLHLAVLGRELRNAEAEVLILDPLYLSLLAGVGPGGPQASNVYQVGPLLANVSKTCLSAGCTPLLAHHFKITRANPYEEPALEDLAFSGVQEFARQWLLVGRRKKYETGTGNHQLWLSVGGSCGHSGLWALDVAEGTVNDAFAGRRWQVSITTATEARQDAQDVEQATRKQKDAQHRTPRTTTR
jgi:replicative DNA helicase